MIIQFLLIGIAAIVLILGVLLVVKVMYDKGKQIFNPIKKDNSDYRFIQVKNEKTRNIFKIRGKNDI